VPCAAGATLVSTGGSVGADATAVLACPPASCLPFGCPGYEFDANGLRACGADTVSAPVGTTYTLRFVVLLRGDPVLSAVVTRTVTVVSPCAPPAMYCPALAPEQHCGSAPCAVRAAFAPAPAPAPEPPLYHAHFPALVAASQVTAAIDGGGGAGLMMATPCGTPPPLPLTFCRNNLSTATATSAQAACGVYVMVPESDTSELALAVAAELEPPPTCTAERIDAGRCAGGRNVFTYRAYRGGQNASDVAEIAVTVQSRLVELRVNVIAAFTLRGALNATQLETVAAAFNGSSELLNPALRAAAGRVAALTSSCVSGAHAGASVDLALRADAAAALDSQLTSAGNTTVQVCCCTFAYSACSSCMSAQTTCQAHRASRSVRFPCLGMRCLTLLRSCIRCQRP
jgi:hypothetical protein